MNGLEPKGNTGAEMKLDAPKTRALKSILSPSKNFKDCLLVEAG